jgi:hypothetical protein
MSISNPNYQELIKLLQAWKRQIQINYKAHKNLSLYYKRRFYIMGGSATALGTILTATSLAIGDRRTEWMQIALDVCLGVVSALSGLVITLGDDGRSVNHHEAYNRYKALELLITNVLAIPPSARGDIVTIVDSIRQQFDDIVASSPLLNTDNADLPTVVNEVNDGINPEEVHIDVENLPQQEGETFSDRIRIVGQMESDRCHIANKNQRCYNLFQYQLDRLKDEQNKL